MAFGSPGKGKVNPSKEEVFLGRDLLGGVRVLEGWKMTTKRISPGPIGCRARATRGGYEAAEES
jgi:hypothetical protein